MEEIPVQPPSYPPTENYDSIPESIEVRFWRRFPVLISFLLGIATVYGISYTVAIGYRILNSSVDDVWGFVGISLWTAGFGLGMMFVYYFLLTKSSSNKNEVPRSLGEKIVLTILGVIIAVALWYFSGFYLWGHMDIFPQIGLVIFLGFGLSLLIIIPIILNRPWNWGKKVLAIFLMFGVGVVGSIFLNYLLSI
jgi:hypothetical protein